MNEFVRVTALELVFAWQNNESEEVRKVLERVMCNIGIDKKENEFILTIGKSSCFLGYIEKGV